MPAEIRPEYHDVVIVGSGLSGIAMAIQLKRKLGITDVRILSKDSDCAGTWNVNKYPGAACDVPAAVYSFSFAQRGDWTTFYPQAPELKQYFQNVVSEYGINEYFHMKTTVKEARFDTATNLWHVWSQDDDDGERHHYVAKIFVSAVGSLSEPNPPGIEGHETFKGPLFHTARWDTSVDLTGKDVLIVGNGCTAAQVVPSVAPIVKSLTQAVRSKHWYAPVPQNPLNKLAPWGWLVRHIPFFTYLNRFIIWSVLESHFTITLLNPIGAMFRRHWAHICTQHAKKNAPPEYLDALLPTVEEVKPACKRRVITDEYLPALKRDNIKLERSKIVKIKEDGAMTADGRFIKADVIVMANGFQTRRAGFPMALYDKDGVEVSEGHWPKFGGGGPSAYRSTLMSGFPNFATIPGVNSGTGHMSLIFTSENQVNLVLELAKPALRAPKPSQAAIEHLPTSSAGAEGLDKVPTFEPKAEAELREQAWLSWAHSQLVFSTGCGAWYEDKHSGRISAMYPDWQWRFALRSTFPNWSDFTWTGLPNNKQTPSTMPWWKWAGNKILGLGTIPHVSDEQAGLPSRRARRSEGGLRGC